MQLWNKIRSWFKSDIALKIEHAIEDLGQKILSDAWPSVVDEAKKLAAAADLDSPAKKAALIAFITPLVPAATPSVVLNLIVELAVSIEHKAFTAIFGQKPE